MSKLGKPRVTEPERKRGVIRFEMPEDVLGPEHPARVLWQALGKEVAEPPRLHSIRPAPARGAAADGGNAN